MILRNIIPRLTFSLVLLTAFASNNLVTATIKGDKEVQEPDPLPPKPLPVSVVPKVSHVDTADDDDIVTTSKSLKSSSSSDTDTIGGEGNDDEVAEAGHETSKFADAESTPVKGSTLSGDAEPETLISSTHSFALSFLMIVFSEIGDKTFLIAALMAMKHSRMLVFSAAFSSLVVMTVLSALLGHAVPTLLPKKLTNWAASVLFFVFGVRMFMEGLKMEKSAGVDDEMKEVEQELHEKEQEARGRSGSTASIMEEGLVGSRSQKKNPLRRSTSSPTLSDDSDDEGFNNRSAASEGTSIKAVTDGIQNLAALLLSPAWVQTFVMTFLGEWGDRSQIATIAMAAGQDYWFVILGAIVGHGCCTAGAVVGGKLLAERISVRNVTLGGAAAFLVFGIIYLFEAIYT